jgi:hypothetical protein
MPPLHTLVAGNTGQGKSLYCAYVAQTTLEQNKKRFERTGLKRELWLNLKLAPHIEQEYAGYIQYWGEPSGWKYDAEWIAKNLYHADLIWDEISEELGADSWERTSRAMKSFLRQYRKRGVRILSNTQDHADVSIHARRRLHTVLYATKLLGSRDISATLPPPRFVWGVVILKQVQNPKETDPTKIKFDTMPDDVLFITKDLTEVYDTTAIVGVSEFPPLKHIKRKCDVCGLEHTKHE